MEKHDVIVIGASAGGIEALTELFRRLRPNLQAAIFIVVHISPASKSYLPSILSRQGPIPVEHAQDGQPFRYGRAYIAPPNQHLLLEDGHVQLTLGPKENGFRPAVDPMFESAARAYGSRTVGIVLSGNLYDGSKGLLAIKKAGGITVVQDPEQAIYPSMPSSALQYVRVDYVLPVPEIAALINMMQEQVSSNRGGSPVNEEKQEKDNSDFKTIQSEFISFEKGNASNRRSVLSCPDCGGVLWELQDDKIVHYRCHVGHDFSPEVLLSNQDEQVEKAFWTAIRALVEKAALANRLAVRASKTGYTDLEKIYLEQARQAERDAELLRGTWFGGMARTSGGKTDGEVANEEVTKSEE